MDISRRLDQFFTDISVDARITAMHISVYTAVLRCANRFMSDCISMYSYELMDLSKISCGKTYYRVIRELSEFGYILYEPSFHKNRRSNIRLLA